MRVLLSGILLFALCSPAFAQDAGAVAQNFAWLGDNMRSLSHTLMTIGGVGLAIGLAAQAFGRRQVNVANVPTFPRYMTSPQQYRFGSIVFVIFASGFFLLLVYEHKEVARVADLFGEGLAKNIIDAIKDDAAPYLLVVAAMCAVYLYCLKKEANWNPLLMMRDAIHTWISIPQLAGDIVGKIQFSLEVPPAAKAEVVRNSTEVLAGDFDKGENTPERIWAQTCYMKWWLTQGKGAGEDGIFFTEPSFGFKELREQFDKASTRMRAWRGGQPVEVEDLADKIKELHNKFARLVACYLVYRNASLDALNAEARRFGIEPTSHAAGENPVKYWIVYALALVTSVYVGVYACGIAYDWMAGAGFVPDQDFERVQSWIMYSLSNFGVAIIAILLLRIASPYLGLGVHQTHLLTYCWTFLVAFLTGPFGLAMAAHFFGPAKYQAMPLLEVYRTGADRRLHLLLSRSANMPGFAEHQSLLLDRRLAPAQLLRVCRDHALPAASAAAGAQGGARCGVGHVQVALRRHRYDVLHRVRTCVGRAIRAQEGDTGSKPGAHPAHELSSGAERAVRR